MQQAYSYSGDEFTEFILSNLNLDRQMFDHYLLPRWNNYSDVFLRLWMNYPNNSELQKIETVAVLGLMVTEAFVRSTLKRLNKNAIYDLEIKDTLLPFHRDIWTLLELLRKNSLLFSDEVKMIYSSERAVYEKLLSELTKILRGTNPILALEHSFNAEDQNLLITKLENLIQQVSELKEDKQIKKTPPPKLKEVRLVFPEEVQTELLERLGKKIEPESESVLKNLLENGVSSERVFFKSSLSELGRIFIKLQKAGKLEGIQGIEIIRWLADHFYFHNKDAKPQGYTKVTESGAKLVIYNKKNISKDPIE